MQTPGRGGGCGSEDYLYAGDTYFQEGQDNSVNQVHTLEHKTLPAPHNYKENEDLSGGGG